MSDDDGRKEVDKILEEMEKKIKRIYAKAEKEVAEKAADYMRRFAIKDQKWQEWVAEGKKTPEAYQAWRQSQLLMGERWELMRAILAEDYTNADKIAKSVIEGYMPEVYASAFNFGTYEIEHEALLSTSFTLYDRQTVERLLKGEDEIIPPIGGVAAEAVRAGKIQRWNEEQIQSVMLQGVLQGESIPKIAKRLEEVGETSHKAAIRDARTITNGVENAGHLDSYKRAEKMGIQCKKKWLATLDGRTRHWHRLLDGQTAEMDKPFQSELGEIMYPGDPTAHPGDIYNCRCRIVSEIKGFEVDFTDPSIRRMDGLGDMSYDEWKEQRKAESDPITKQEDIGESIKNSYIWKYRRG